MKVFSLCSQCLSPLEETPQRFGLHLLLFKAALIRRTPSRKAFKAVFKEKGGCVLAWTGRAALHERSNGRRCRVRSHQPSEGYVSNSARRWYSGRLCKQEERLQKRVEGGRGAEGGSGGVVHVKVSVSLINKQLLVYQ